MILYYIIAPQLLWSYIARGVMRQFGSLLKHQTWLPPWTYSSTRYKWQGSSRVININATLSLYVKTYTKTYIYTYTYIYIYTLTLYIYIFIHMKLWSLSRVYKVDTESQTIRASYVHTWFRSNLDFACVPTCWNKMVKLTPIGRKSKYNYFNLQLLF